MKFIKQLTQLVFTTAFLSSMSSIAKPAQDEITKKQTGVVEAYAVRGKITDLSKLESKKSEDQRNLNYLFPLRQTEPKYLRVVAGPGTSGGGGDIVICGQYQFRLLESSIYPKYFLADTLDLFKNGTLDKAEAIPEEIWMEAIFKTLNESVSDSPENEKLGDLVRKRLQELSFILVDEVLPELDDDQIDVTALGCDEKKQLGIQDLARGEVRVSKELIGRLSFTEIYFFKVHEALISLQKTVDDTTPIRQELRNAIAKIKLENILEKVSHDFIELPQSLRYLWALKVLYQNEFLIKFSAYKGNCKVEKKSKSLTEDCIAPLISWRSSFDEWDKHAFMSIGMSYYWNLGDAGFLTHAPKKPHLYQAIQEIGSTSWLVYTASQYFNPRNSFSRKEDINLAEIEATHTYLIGAIRKTQWNNVLASPANIVEILNLDFENFRRKFLNDNYVPLTDKISDPSDKWFSSVGSCYVDQNFKMYRTSKDSKMHLIGWISKVFSADKKPVALKGMRIEMSKNFMNCLKEKGYEVRRINQDENEEAFQIALSQYFEKNFKEFIEYFQTVLILTFSKE